MKNSTQSRTEKKLKQTLITDFITRKSPPKTNTAGEFVIFTRYETLHVGMISETLCAEEEDESYLGLPMYKSILMNLEVFPIFISGPPNLILKIPKIASKKIFSDL